MTNSEKNSVEENTEDDEFDRVWSIFGKTVEKLMQTEDKAATGNLTGSYK